MSKEVDAFSGNHDVFFKLTVVFAVLTMLLSVLLILLVIIWMRKHQRDDALFFVLLQKQDGEMVNYAALHFSNKKNKRPHRRVEAEDPHVVYSSVRQKRT
ncbi:hypothetical protein NFI96_031987 [Prochilodus magdalenae]|nr:hypothetical protein NFI96_031987 [Prochilodus magdalenae]